MPTVLASAGKRGDQLRRPLYGGMFIRKWKLSRLRLGPAASCTAKAEICYDDRFAAAGNYQIPDNTSEKSSQVNQLFEHDSEIVLEMLQGNACAALLKVEQWEHDSQGQQRKAHARQVGVEMFLRSKHPTP